MKRENLIKVMRAARKPIMEIIQAGLLTRDKIPFTANVKEEERICIEFADLLRALHITGGYKGIFGHLANEGKRHPLTGLIMAAMGMIPGSPDYFFMGPWGHGVIEFKAPKGTIQATQRLYQDWCDVHQVPHAYARSAKEGLAVLRSWGAIS